MHRENITEAAACQADQGEYAMFDPFTDVPVVVQHTEGQASFVEKNFTSYITNDVIMEKVLQDCSKPASKLVCGATQARCVYGSAHGC